MNWIEHDGLEPPKKAMGYEIVEVFKYNGARETGPWNSFDWKGEFSKESQRIASYRKAPDLSKDNVNHPDHYQSDNGVECIDAIRAALGKDGFIAYCRGNAIKYAFRDKENLKEDLQKGAWHLNRAGEEL